MITRRGGKGIKTMDLTDKTGVLVAACILTKESIADQRLVIVTENGIGIRIKVGEVRVTSSRSAQGVKLIELNETDRVKTVECIDVSARAPGLLVFGGEVIPTSEATGAVAGIRWGRGR